MRVVSASLLVSCAGQKLFEATKGRGGHFDFVLNGKYKIALDTGAKATWIKLNSVAPGGYQLTHGNRVIEHHEEFNYPFVGIVTTEFAVMENMRAGTGIEWKQLLPLVHQSQDAADDIEIGILGASYGSAFARANPVLTIVPMKDHYKIYADESISVDNKQCIVVPISNMGLRLGKWIIQDVVLKLSSGHYVVTSIEVDTGFSMLALPDNMWRHFHRTLVMQGAKLLNSPDAYPQRYSNCYKNKVPSISYGFQAPDMKFTIPTSSFVTFYEDGICDMDVVKHDPDMYGEGDELSFIGVPALSTVVTQLNRRDRTISFCPIPRS